MLIEIPDALLLNRMQLRMHKNLDGTFTVAASPSNTRARGKNTTINCRGYNLSLVMADVAQRVDASIKACEIIP